MVVLRSDDHVPSAQRGPALRSRALVVHPANLMRALEGGPKGEVAK